MSLEYSISLSDKVLVLNLKGKIISDTDLESVHNSLQSQESNSWVFNMDELSHINSTGINFIIRSLTRSRVNNGDLVLCAVRGNVKSLFEIAKINEIFTIYDEIEEALNHFNQ